MITNKLNNQITAPEVRVISDTDENLGVLKLSEALKLAKEKGLDLIEISPMAKPPVCKVISFDKFRYQEEKKLKKARSSQKNVDQKQVQISVREAKNDLQMKMSRVVEFLSEGNQVQILLTMRGRELGNKEFAKNKLQEFLKSIPVPHQVMGSISFGGRNFSAMVAKK